MTETELALDDLQEAPEPDVLTVQFRQERQPITVTAKKLAGTWIAGGALHIFYKTNTVAVFPLDTIRQFVVAAEYLAVSRYEETDK